MSIKRGFPDFSMWAWGGQAALRASLPVPADQGELTKPTLAPWPASQALPKEIHPSAWKMGQEQLLVPRELGGQEIRAGWAAGPEMDQQRRAVGQLLRSTEAPPSSFLKKRFLPKIQPAKAKTGSHKLDSQFLNNLGENEETKTE